MGDPMLPGCNSSPKDDNTHCDPMFAVAVGGLDLLSHHTFNHVAISPFRVLCRVLGYKNPCEQFDSDGQLLSIRTGKKLLLVGGLVTTVIAPAMFLFVVPLYLLEQLFLATTEYGTAAAAAVFPGITMTTILLFVAVAVMFLQQQQQWRRRRFHK